MQRTAQRPVSFRRYYHQSYDSHVIHPALHAGAAFYLVLAAMAWRLVLMARLFVPIA